MNPVVLIVGATSGIGAAVARRLARSGHDLVLAGRALPELERRATDLETRYGVQADCQHFEACASQNHEDFVRRCLEQSGERLHGVFLCHGDMPDASQAPHSVERIETVIATNYTSAVLLLEAFTPHFANRQKGWIAAVTSVAGDRGRPSNHLYGSTKAALSTYLGGLRARLGRDGVAVVDIRPGFVDTPQTYGLPGLFLVADPSHVARDIERGIRRNRAVVYTPWFWRWVMAIIRNIPDRVFGRLEL